MNVEWWVWLLAGLGAGIQIGAFAVERAWAKERREEAERRMAAMNERLVARRNKEQP